VVFVDFHGVSVFVSANPDSRSQASLHERKLNLNRIVSWIEPYFLVDTI
jgi:hypothetical protein